MDIVNSDGSDAPQYGAEFRTLADSDSPYDARVGRMMLEFLDGLRREAAGPRLYATHFNRELWLQYSAPNGASAMIAVSVDHPDYGPLEDGLPQFHYRLSFRIRTTNDATDRIQFEERARSVESACEVVREAISETRNQP